MLYANKYSSRLKIVINQQIMRFGIRNVERLKIYLNQHLYLSCFLLLKLACFADCAKTLSNKTPPIDKINLLIKVAVTFQAMI